MKRSKFNLSHRLLQTGDFGYLYPIVVEDVLPGDKFRLSAEVYMKAIPLMAPILDQVDIRVDYFFVPNRLLWQDWQAFITGAANPLAETLSVSPWLNPKIIGMGTTADPYRLDPVANYLYQLNSKNGDNVNTVGFNQLRLDALPLAAYNKIYYDWYADENLDPYFPREDDQDNPTYLHAANVDVNGKVTSTWKTVAYKLHQRHLHKDYFTASLPWPQKGPEVGFSIPPDDMTLPGTGSAGPGIDSPVNPSDGNVKVQSRFLSDADGNDLMLDVLTDSDVDKGSLGFLSINELRRLSALQRWFERNARWGSRYVEQILSHFGVRTPDYRLNRSEYLGGTVTPINVSETYQTAGMSGQEETADVLGQYAGHLTSYGVNGCRKFKAQEHGWIIGLLSVLPKNSYAQGLQKRFNRPTRLDYAWPEFANLGEQAVLNRELYVSSNNDRNGQTFGYQSRFAEYKSRQDRFDQNFLNVFPWWHLGRFWNSGAMPNLNVSFINAWQGDYSQFDRIFAYSPVDGTYQDTFHFLFQINNRIIVKRPIPKYAVPTLK